VVSVALSLGSPRVAVNDLPALRSPDFPPADDPRPPAILPPPPAELKLPRGGRDRKLARARRELPELGSVFAMKAVLQIR